MLGRSVCAIAELDAPKVVATTRACAILKIRRTIGNSLVGEVRSYSTHVALVGNHAHLWKSQDCFGLTADIEGKKPRLTA